jgi:hypothetical protein
MGIRAGFEPRRGRTTPRGSLGPENAPSCTARRAPTAQIRRGLASNVVGIVRAEIFALPRPPVSWPLFLNSSNFYFFTFFAPFCGY